MAGFSSHTTPGHCHLYLIVRQTKGFQVPLIIGDVAPKGIEIPIIGTHFEEQIIPGHAADRRLPQPCSRVPQVESAPAVRRPSRPRSIPPATSSLLLSVWKNRPVSFGRASVHRQSESSLQFFSSPPSLTTLSTNASCQQEKTENWELYGGEEHLTILLNRSEFELARRVHKPQLMRNVPVRSEPVESADGVN
jgi:hypothetical protein